MEEEEEKKTLLIKSEKLVKNEKIREWGDFPSVHPYPPLRAREPARQALDPEGGVWMYGWTN